jgi:hypothetical protein
MTDYTWAFGDAGTVLNTDSLGVPFVDVTGVSGLDTAPLRTNTDEHQGQDGTYVDTPYMSMRTIVVTGTLYTDPNDPDTLLTSLRSDYNSNVVRPFYFQTPGQPIKFCNGQGGGLQYNVDSNRRIGSTPIQLTVLAGDPYIYDYPPQIQIASIQAGAGIGTGFNMAFNVGFGGPITGDTATVFNAGTHTAYPLITIAGPLSNPTLVDGVSGITMAFSITLSAGDLLVVDCRNKSVVLNGSASRRNSLAGLAWFSTPPKGTSAIQLFAVSGSGNATVQLYNTYY